MFLLFFGLICLFIVAIFLGTFRKTNSIEDFLVQNEGHFKFLTARETYLLIRNDEDKYIQNMDIHMLSERGYTKHEDYISTAARTALSFNDIDIYNIDVFARFIDTFTKKYYDVDPLTKPWIFALTEGRVYERGQPHVRGNTIFLSSDMLERESWDSCQMGWTLLYMRLQVLFGQQKANGIMMPWSSTSDFKNQKAYGYLPTCRAFSKAGLIL